MTPASHAPDCHTANKAALAPFRAALYDIDLRALHRRARRLMTPDCPVHWAYPLETMTGPDALIEQVFAPLVGAIPDLERRDSIVIAGPAGGTHWVGCGGHYTGLFRHPWLDIRPTGRPVRMRFHEFYRIEAGRIVEIQALWDIPELMLQAGVWPLAPSLGLEWHVPGPATADGLVPGPWDPAAATRSATLVGDMLRALKRHAEGGVAAMALDRYWHPAMIWYGPSGIGTGRGIGGFRAMHQIPFLNAMPDRNRHPDTPAYLFGDGHYAGFTAWPGMVATITGDGWLGIAPSGQAITLRSLDFWRREGDLIRENWVLVDLLAVYKQIGVDVFHRMREMVPY